MPPKLLPCWSAVKIPGRLQCPFADQDFMIAKARAKMANEEMTKGPAQAAEAAEAQYIVDQIGVCFKPCSADVEFRIGHDGRPAARSRSCSACAHLPRQCVFCHEFVVDIALHVRSVCPKISRSDDDVLMAAVTTVTGRFLNRGEVARQLVQLGFQLTRIKSVASISAQTTGTFIIRTGERCLLWSADQQVIHDPNLTVSVPTTPNSLLLLENIAWAYQIAQLPRKQKKRKIK